jgi:hypothetical protein
MKVLNSIVDPQHPGKLITDKDIQEQVLYENFLMQTLGFDFSIDHP